MKRIRTYTVLLFLITLISFVPQARAQELLSPQIPTPQPTIVYTLPYPGILPDHTLYPIKLVRDNILLLFARDPIKKSQLYLLFADKYISMGKLLWEKGNVELAGVSFIKAENQILRAIESLAAYKTKHILPPGLVDKIELALKKHEEIMNTIQSLGDANTGNQKLSEALEINHQAIQQTPLLK